LSFLLYTTLSAQSDIKFKYLSSDQGLAYNSVKCFCEDQYGFLWIGLEGGLDRYDGKNFIHFTIDPFDSTSLHDPIVDALHLDKKDRLWIGSSGGLSLFNYKDMSFTRSDIGLDSFSTTNVYNINETFEDGKIVLWLSVFDLGLIKYYPDEKISKIFLPVPGDINSLNDNTIFKIHVDEENILWLATLRGGLNRFDPATEKFTHYIFDSKNKKSIPDNHIICVTGSVDGNKNILWLGSGKNGLIKFDKNSEMFSNYILDPGNRNAVNFNRVLNIVEYNGKLLIGTPGAGLQVFNPWSESFERYTSGLVQSELGNLIITSYKSKSGQVYLGTYNEGIIYLESEPTGFNTIHCSESEQNAFSASSIFDIDRTKDGSLYIGHSGGIDIINEKDMSITKMPDIPVLNELLKNTMVTSLLVSKYEDNIIWIGAFQRGLIKYNIKTRKYNIYKNDPNDSLTISHNTVSSLCEDSFGYLWFSGANNGLNRFDIQTGKVKRFFNDLNNDKSLSSNYVMKIYEDPDSILWICTEMGINRYNRDTDNFTRFSFDEENVYTNSKIIASVIIDPVDHEILWIATAAGLIKYNKISGEFKRYTTKDGLASNLVIAIRGYKNSIWICSINGISLFNTNDESVINFDKSDGIEIDEFSMTDYQYMDRIYFGASDGLVYFQPDSIDFDTTVSKVILTDFYLFNQVVKPGSNSFLDSALTVKKNLVLGYEDHVFAINFTAPKFKGYQKQKFRFMLAGFSDDWINTTPDNRLATFTNIPPGEYEFRAQAANMSGKWNNKYTSLSIIIEPPFWKTWWAYTLYVLFSIGVIAGFVQLRTRQTIRENIRLENEVAKRTEQLRKLNSDKDRFFSIVAHDIKSPLVAMLNFSKALKKHYNLMTEQEKYEAVSEIYESLHNSYRYLNNLLDWSRVQLDRFEFSPQVVNLKELVEKSISYLCPVAEVKNISLVSEIKDDVTAYADYEMVSIVIRNLLSNGIKFTNNGGSVRIKCSVKDKVELKVCDSGVGINNEDLNRLFRIDKIIKTKGTANEEGTGLGLILCKELITKNNGEIFAESKVDKGSTFTVILPRNKS
jgi:signal transduction histidine kinase/ligand-binding sensor domain-containing protein